MVLLLRGGGRVIIAIQTLQQYSPKFLVSSHLIWKPKLSYCLPTHVGMVLQAPSPFQFDGFMQGPRGHQRLSIVPVRSM